MCSITRHPISQYQESLSESAFAAAISTVFRYFGGYRQRVSKVFCWQVTSGFWSCHRENVSRFQTGRKLATGPYIYQVSIIQKPMDHCVNVNGSQTYMLSASTTALTSR